MARNIDVGNVVIVVYSDSPDFTGVVEHLPCNTGDMLYVSNGKERRAINTSGSSFTEIRLIKEVE